METREDRQSAGNKRGKNVMKVIMKWCQIMTRQCAGASLELGRHYVTDMI